MKDYVLRIYRRKKNSPRTVVGVVKEVGVEGSKTFSNLDELWEILNPSKAGIWESRNRNELNKPNRLKTLKKPQH